MRLLATCLLLASAVLLQQATPQRVERRQEWCWCLTEHGGHVVRRTMTLVNGQPAGAPREERLVTVEEADLRFDWTGP